MVALHRAILLCASCLAYHVSAVAITSEKALREHLLTDYDVYMAPGMGQKSTRVNISMNLKGLFEIDQQTGTFKVDMFLRAHWKDPRLAYNALNISLPYGLPHLNLQMVQTWKPDIFLANAVQVQHQASETLFYTDPDGTLVWSRRYIAQLRCAMHFQSFPFDLQHCMLGVESYHDRIDVATLGFAERKSGDNGFGNVEANQWTQFEDTSESGTMKYSTGEFAYASIKFSMKREAQYWMLNGVLPAMIFVAMSYCGYWIDAGAVPARVTLAITSVLIMVTHMSRMSAAMPVVTYRVWMSDYLLGCVLFNLMAGITYTFTNYALHLKVRQAAKKKLREEAAALQISDVQLEVASNKSVHKRVLHKVLGKTWKDRVAKISVKSDWHMRWFFPLCFVAFNIAMFNISDSGPYGSHSH